MAGERPLLYAWDTCIFIAWVNGEVHRPLHAIEGYLNAMKKKEIAILVSAIVVAEVLDRPETPKARDTMRKLLGHSSIQPVDVDFRIAELAADLRERSLPLWRESGIMGKPLKAPDALIVATAVIYKANLLHTFDNDIIAMSAAGAMNGLIAAEPVARDGQDGFRY